MMNLEIYEKEKMLDAIKGSTTLIYGTTSADVWTQVSAN